MSGPSEAAKQDEQNYITSASGPAKPSGSPSGTAPTPSQNNDI